MEPCNERILMGNLVYEICKGFLIYRIIMLLELCKYFFCERGKLFISDQNYVYTQVYGILVFYLEENISISFN